MFEDQQAFDLETGLGGSRANEVEHRLEAVQRLACPMFADLAKEPVFDRIPLGSSRRKMAYGHGQTKPISHLLLKRPLPHAHSSPIAPAAVSQNEEAGSPRIILLSRGAPPPGDIVGGELWGVVGGADKNRTAVAHRIVNPEGNGHALAL